MTDQHELLVRLEDVAGEVRDDIDRLLILAQFDDRPDIVAWLVDVIAFHKGLVNERNQRDSCDDLEFTWPSRSTSATRAGMTCYAHPEAPTAGSIADDGSQGSAGVELEHSDESTDVDDTFHTTGRVAGEEFGYAIAGDDGPLVQRSAGGDTGEGGYGKAIL
jgi:hypothetical protein